MNKKSIIRISAAGIFLVILSLALFGFSLLQNAGADSPNLIFDHSEINMFDACSYYNLQYSGTLINWMYDMVTLKISKITELYGSFKNKNLAEMGWQNWEWQAKENYTEKNCTNICIYSNTTAYEPVNDTYYFPVSSSCSELCLPYNITKEVWIKNTGDNLNKYGSQLFKKTAEKGYTKIRFCSEFQREHIKGFGSVAALDHIPEFKGIAYPELAWWLSNYSYLRNMTVNSTITSNIKKIPVPVNGSEGFRNGTDREHAWCLLDDLSSSSVNGTIIFYYNSLTDYRCANASDNTEFLIDIDEGNGTTGSFAKSKALWQSAYSDYVFHFNGTARNATGGLPKNNITYGEGLVGKGAVFDSQSDQVIFGDIDLGNRDHTIEFWFKLTQWPNNASNSGMRSFFEKPYGASTAWDQINLDANRVAFGFNNGNSQFYSTYIINDLNKWYHVVLVMSNITGIYANATLYINGDYNAENATEPAIGIGDGTEIWLIGQHTSINSFDSGLIDEFRIYNKSLSSAEIKARYETLAPHLNWSVLGGEQIMNTAPFIENITIFPSTAYTNSTLNCSANAGDADSDKMNVSIIWYNGSDVYGIVTYLNLVSGQAISNSTPSAIQSKGETWNCTINSTDAQGLAGSPNSTTVTISNFAPQIPIIWNPANNSNISTRNVTFEYNSTDIDGDSISYYIYIDDKLNKTTTSETHQVNISEGSHNFTIKAGDSEANSSNSSALFFTIDTEKPHVYNHIRTPASGVIWSDLTFYNFSIDVNDTIMGVDTVILEIFNYGTYSSADSSQIWQENSTRYLWNNTGWAQGHYEYRWVVNDSINNINRYGNFSYDINVAEGGNPSSLASETVKPAEEEETPSIIGFAGLIKALQENPFFFLIILFSAVTIIEMSKTKKKRSE